MSSLRSRYYVLEQNLNEVLNELEEEKKNRDDVFSGQGNMEDFIALKASKIEDDVEGSIDKMDSEIQKSLSHQKAENSRLQQQITQLKGDNTVITNQLKAVQKRIEDIELQVGKIGGK
ncbi:MAG: hypothetical protein MJ252_23705 [archaeon]|nr:hypothetical protein [archaeon]